VTGAGPAPAAAAAAAQGHRHLVGTLALVTGALCISFAPIMVKVSELGPQATAFWRLLLSVPPLALWAFLERRHALSRSAVEGAQDGLRAPVPWGLMILAGVLFAGDLITWHAGIIRTSAANATFLANLTPVVVVVVTWVTTRRLPQPLFLAAVGIALAGSGLMSGGAPGQSREALLGDALSAATALWYAAYLLTTARVRGTTGTGMAMLVPTVVAVPVTLVATLVAGEPVWPPGAVTPGAIAAVLWPLLMLGVVVHVAGQGLVSFALGKVPATLASVLILIQPVGAAMLGWGLLGEVLGPVQIAGAGLVLVGVWLARRPA
jgi:drug/metabolite transporter (DMT)-like permease